MSKSFIFSSESVGEGHPDKVSDSISDSILDACLEQDPQSRVACETLVKSNCVTIAGEITTAAKFDYEVAKNLVGTWEFEISDPTSRNITIIRMSIDISLNVLMTTIVNGQVISKIFTQMITISATAILIGDFAIITDLVFVSASRMSMNLISIPENTAPPTNESEIPDSGSALSLSGDKSEEEPQTDEDGIIIPPTDATTSSSTTEDMGSVFEQSLDQVTATQTSSLSSDTSETGTDSQTTNTSTPTTDTTDDSDQTSSGSDNSSSGTDNQTPPPTTNTGSTTSTSSTTTQTIDCSLPENQATFNLTSNSSMRNFDIELGEDFNIVYIIDA